MTDSESILREQLDIGRLTLGVDDAIEMAIVMPRPAPEPPVLNQRVTTGPESARRAATIRTDNGTIRKDKNESSLSALQQHPEALMRGMWPYTGKRPADEGSEKTGRGIQNAGEA